KCRQATSFNLDAIPCRIPGRQRRAVQNFFRRAQSRLSRLECQRPIAVVSRHALFQARAANRSQPDYSQQQQHDQADDHRHSALTRWQNYRRQDVCDHFKRLRIPVVETKTWRNLRSVGVTSSPLNVYGCGSGTTLSSILCTSSWTRTLCTSAHAAAAVMAVAV